MGNSFSVYSKIEFPIKKFQSFDSSPVCFTGWCIRSNGEVPDAFLIQIGKRTITSEPAPRFDPIQLPRKVVPQNARFGLECTFRTGKGLKWVTVQARWKDGSCSTIGRKLLRFRNKSNAHQEGSPFEKRFAHLWKQHQKLFTPLTSLEQKRLESLTPLAIHFLLPLTPQNRSGQIQRTLQSLRNQKGEWKLSLIVNPKEGQSHALAKKYAEKYPEISWISLEDESMERGYNLALRENPGDYIAILSPGDILAEDALPRIRLFQAAYPEADVFYTDENYCGYDGIQKSPLLKPAHSPHLLEEHAYWRDLTVYRKSTLLREGGWNPEYKEASTWELQLRLQKNDARICHLPHVLYHRLPLEEGGTSPIINEEAGKRMLQDFFAGEGNEITPVAKGSQGAFSLQFKPQSKEELVSIIIPFRDKPELLKNAVNSVLKSSTYPSFELILVDNDSQEKETLTLLQKLKKDPRVRVSPCRRDFNFAALINHGAREAKGKYLLFLNNDTQVITPEWLEVMLGYARREEIGAVGALLYFEDGTLQHAGAVMGLTGLAGHAYSGLRQEEVPGRWADYTRDVSVVTAACLMVRKSLFEEVGGFQERFTVCGNDVDFCLTLHEHGYRNVVASMARLHHFESKSRDPGKIPVNDFEVSLERYAPWLDRGDPYWHPSLSLFHAAGLPRLTDERPIHLELLRSVPGGTEFQFPSSKERIS